MTGIPPFPKQEFWGAKLLTDPEGLRVYLNELAARIVIGEAVQVIHVDPTKGNYRTLKEAFEYVDTQNPTAANPWAVRVRSGRFIEDNSDGPLVIPPYTDTRGEGCKATRIVAKDGSQPLLCTPENKDFDGCFGVLTLEAPTPTSAAALVVDPKVGGKIQEIVLTEVAFSGFSSGLEVNRLGTKAILFSPRWVNCNKCLTVDGAAIQGLGLIAEHATSGEYGVKVTGADGIMIITDLLVEGVFNKGLYCLGGSRVSIQAYQSNNPVIAVNTDTGGDLLLAACEIQGETTTIKTENASDVVTINGADFDVRKISIAAGSQFHYDGNFPTRADCVQFAEQLCSRFASGIDCLQRWEDIDFSFMDFFVDQSKIASSTNVDFMANGKAVLHDKTVPVQWDSCDALDNWVEHGVNTTEGVLTLDNVVFKEGTGSIKASITAYGESTVGTYRYAIRRNIAPAEDWSALFNFKLWMKSSVAGAKVHIALRNAPAGLPVFLWNTYTFKGTDWEQVIIDLGQLTPRANINALYFYFTREDSAYTVNIDDIERAAAADYESSGNIVSVSASPVFNREFYEFLVKADAEEISADTAITVDISLDGGTHWLTDIGIHDFAVWLQAYTGGVLETADGAVAWDNIKNLKFRHNLSTTDATQTPVLGGYAAVWRVDRS